MNYTTFLITAATVALTSVAMAAAEPRESPSPAEVLDSLQKSIAAAGQKIAPALALVKIERGTSQPSEEPSPGAPRIVTMGGGGRPTSASGILISPDGHLLVNGIFKSDQDQRLIVLLGEDEFVARSLKVDESLGMSILKIESGEAFAPIDLGQATELAVGEWAVALSPTDEELDFQTITTPVVCQGTRDGFYRQFRVGLMGGAANALVVDLDGRPVGFLERTGTVTALKDLQGDIRRMMKDASGKTTAEEEKKKKGWLGAMLAPVNKDWAKAGGITPSAVHVTYVCKDSPAEQAGLKAGDLVTGVRGQPLRLTGTRALDYFTKALQPRAGEDFALTALRDGKTIELKGTFASEPESDTLRADDIGVTVASLSEAEIFSMNLVVDQGVLVTEVIKGSPAANSGSLGQTLLARNDVIVELAGQPVTDVAGFGKILEKLRREKPPVVLVKYQRGLLSGFAGLNLSLGEKEQQNKQ
jgi:serine protease Do